MLFKYAQTCIRTNGSVSKYFNILRSCRQSSFLYTTGELVACTIRGDSEIQGSNYLGKKMGNVSRLIRVITKLPNSEQSYKGKVKTHRYINRQNQSTTENCENRIDPDLVQAFLTKWWVESDFKAPNPFLSLRLKVSGCHYNSIYNNT